MPTSPNQTPEGRGLTPEEKTEVRAISDRIARLEMARGLIEAGKKDKALALLLRLRDAYQDAAKKKLVEHMIKKAQEP